MKGRRRFLADTGALAWLTLLSGRAGSAQPLRPPAAKRVSVADDYYGTRVSDPYRWMENAKDPDWIPWLKAQDAFTRETLSRVPGRDALLARVSGLSGDLAVTRRVAVGGARLFFEQQPAGAQNFKLFVREGGGAVRTLIDPTTINLDGVHVSLDWWLPSESGQHVAYGLSPAGSEASIAHVMDAATGRVLDERIPNTDWGLTGWLPDGSGFFYIQFTGERGTPSFYLNSVVKLHQLGTDPSTDRVVLRRGMHAQIPMSEVQAGIVRPIMGSDRALVMVADIRRERAVWTTPLADLIAGKPVFERVAVVEDLVVGIAASGDDLFLLSNKDASRGRVLATSASKPSLSTAKEVLPQSNVVAEGLYPVRGGVLVRLMDGGIQRLTRASREGRAAAVNLPFEGSVRDVFSSELREDAHLLLAGWLQPQGIWRLAPDGRVQDAGLEPAPPFDLSGYVAERRIAAARDGTRVPYTIIARRGWRSDASNPVLATGYGAYQYALSPGFQPRVLAFLDAGGVYVVAGVRGGGEYGREWHKAGQKATKPNTWRDLIDVCETLIRSRITASSRLVIHGGSAGGITVGRALTERPDLFAGAVAEVGWMNPLRYVAEQYIVDIDEWGPIVDAESFRIMYQMDSYHAISEGKPYPAVLITTGVNDPRVASFHSGKFAARLQDVAPADSPVLLRVDFDSGHGVGSTRAQRDALAADIYTFALWRAGARGFQTG